MSELTYTYVHNRFKLNGYYLNKEDLCNVAYSFIKEGNDFEKPLGNFILDWFDNHSYIEMLTSGSTGTPKIIRVEKQAMINSAIATGFFFKLEAGNKVLHCLPVKYVAGKMMFVRAFILGLEVDLIAPSTNPLEFINTNYDFTAMVPIQVQNSISKLHFIKKIIVGGAKIDSNLQKKLINVKSSIFETFGMTETVSHIAARKVNEKYFKIFPNIIISIDKNNCLLIDAPKISPYKIETNDIVNLISDNQFEFIGRLDNVVNSGGIKLIPERIEEKLSLIIRNRFFVIGQKDSKLGEKLVLIIEGNPLEIDFSKVKNLDKYEIPKDIYFLPKFIETPTGKIIRKDTFKLI